MFQCRLVIEFTQIDLAQSFSSILFVTYTLQITKPICYFRCLCVMSDQAEVDIFLSMLPDSKIVLGLLTSGPKLSVDR